MNRPYAEIAGEAKAGWSVETHKLHRELCGELTLPKAPEFRTLEVDGYLMAVPVLPGSLLDLLTRLYRLVGLDSEAQEH